MAKITLHYSDGDEPMTIIGGYYAALELLEYLSGGSGEFPLDDGATSCRVNLDTGLDVTDDVLAELAVIHSNRVDGESRDAYERAC